MNVLLEADSEQLWLPEVIFENTDQKESTRLGVKWEWKTSIIVVREGNSTQTGMDEVNEAEIFSGLENSLSMQQKYTKKFQCAFQLARYPFDTQVWNFVSSET